MARKHITGITRLNTAIWRLKEIAEEVEENLRIKKDWFEEKSDRYQESDAGQEWEKHISEVEDLIGEIENMEPIDLED